MAVTSIKIAIRMEGVPPAPEQGKRVLVPVDYQGQKFIADLNAKSLRKLNKQAAEFEYPAITAIEGHFGGIEEGAIKIINAGAQIFEKKPKEPKEAKEPKPEGDAKPASENSVDAAAEPETLTAVIQQVTTEVKVPKPDPLARPVDVSAKEPAPASRATKGKAAKRQGPRNCDQASREPGTYELPPSLLDANKHRATKERRDAVPYVPAGASQVGSMPFSVAS